MWAKTVSPHRLLAADDRIHRWRADLLAAFGGMAGADPGDSVD
jgi:hypothetical protein